MKYVEITAIVMLLKMEKKTGLLKFAHAVFKIVMKFNQLKFESNRESLRKFNKQMLFRLEWAESE